MALIKCSEYSEVLGQWIDFEVIIPRNVEGDFKTLYLLHGLKFDYSSWTRRTNIERYADEAGIAVVMPDGGRSFYTDMVNGRPYYSFVSDELISMTRRLFRLSDKREDTFIGGLSMGGYGAFRIGFMNPDKFSKIAVMSAATDVSYWTENPEWERENYLITGGIEDIKGSEYDLYKITEDLVKSGKPLPSVYQACGTEDFLYKMNLEFRDFLKSKGFDVTYTEGSGEHNYYYWESKIKELVTFVSK